MRVKEPNLPGGAWGPPLIGVMGTIAGMLFAFARVGTEPDWKIVLEDIGSASG